MKLENKIKNCKLCGDLPKPKCNSFKTGNCNILIVGESPAKDGWLKSGKAFYDVNNNLQATGKTLNKLLNLIDLTIDDVAFTECCKCHISNRKLLEKCSQNCKQYLLEQIKTCKETIILSMGVFATQILLDEKIKNFSNYVGKHFKIFNKTIIPIYHCSPVNPKSYVGNIDIFKAIKKAIKIWLLFYFILHIQHYVFP